MKQILGIHYHQASELPPTQESLRAWSPGVDVFLLRDGADGSAPGAAAAFNRLARRCLDGEADVVVFLEGGCRVGPEWLDRLLRALDADEGHGLAGPSTNRAWNEQGAFLRARGSAIAVARTARDAVSRFGDGVRSLGPLHSLAAFCFAVRREVIYDVGAADEGYGAGPCWEMDYSARALRAGFLGVWAQGAYVYRPPLSTDRRLAEERMREASKRRYQDNLCALRLRGTAEGYESHCRGEACEHFAPKDLIRIHRPFDEVGLPSETEPDTEPERVAGPEPQPEPEPTGGLLDVVDEEPLVSCLMPTADRRVFVPRAIDYFLRQDYPNRELLIIDDGSDPVADLVPEDPRIRYLRLDSRQSLGSKRNLACREAKGDVLMHWDDDDWHAPHRISYQVAELGRTGAQLCGLDRLLFFDPEGGKAWRYAYPSRSRKWLAGGTFCYTRELQRRYPFPHVDIGEDNRFAWSVPDAGMAALDDEGIYVAMIHGRNTSRKRCAGSRWQPVPASEARARLGGDATFYDLVAVGAGGSRPASLPLVSCIMPTRDRRRFVPLAIASFLRQDYPNRELVILDDGDDPISDLVPDHPSVRYQRLARRRTVGAKRNLACEAARGEIIVHWDDDDWYAPGRLTAQVAALVAGEADVTALAMRFVLTLRPFRFWRCHPEHHAKIHHRDLCPGTIAYHRSLWRQGSYPARRNCAEDVVFLRGLPPATRLRRLEREDLFVCLRHGDNTWSMPLDPRRAPLGWQRIDAPPFLPSGDVARYADLAAAKGVAA